MGFFDKIKKAFAEANKAPVYPLGHVEKTLRFEYELKNNNGWVLCITYTGIDFSMKEDVSMTAYAGENQIKKERLFYGRMGDDEASSLEEIPITGIDGADKICFHIVEGEDHRGGEDEDYHYFDKFCIDLTSD